MTCQSAYHYGCGCDDDDFEKKLAAVTKERDEARAEVERQHKFLNDRRIEHHQHLQDKLHLKNKLQIARAALEDLLRSHANYCDCWHHLALAKLGEVKE